MSLTVLPEPLRSAGPLAPPLLTPALAGLPDFREARPIGLFVVGGRPAVHPPLGIEGRTVCIGGDGDSVGIKSDVDARRFRQPRRRDVDRFDGARLGTADQPRRTVGRGPNSRRAVARPPFQAHPLGPPSGGGQGRGNSIFLRHGLADGSAIHTFYAHLSEIDPEVVVGACVQAGQRLGMKGNSGIGSAAHLHFAFQTTPEILQYTVESSYEYDSRNPDDFYGVVEVRRCG